MIILKRLYSETGTFDPVVFRGGINIVQGVYEHTKRGEGLNGIGKSTLVRLIDFSLISDVGKEIFNVERLPFLKGESAILEFEVEGETHVIKRSFDEPNTPKYGKDLSSLEQFKERELTALLGKLLFGRDAYKGAFENKWFRDLIKFFVKDDIHHHGRIDPLRFYNVHASNFEAYSYNLFLLNLPNESVNLYYTLSKKKDELEDLKRKAVERIKEETGKNIEETRSAIRLLDERILTLEKAMKDFKFVDSYDDVTKEITQISKQISELLMKLTYFRRRLLEFKRSYDYTAELDKEAVVSLYEQLRSVLGNEVRKTLDEVIEFRNRISENRKRFLQSREVEIERQADILKTQISTLENKRSDLYKILDEKGEFDSVRNTYSLLIQEKIKKQQLASSVSSVANLDRDINIKKEEISKVIGKLATDITAVEEQIAKIHGTFFGIVRLLVPPEDVDKSVFDIRHETNENSPLKVTVKLPKTLSLGRSRLELLAYDLTVFFGIIEQKRRLPHFLIHDGVFHGIDIKTVVRILNLIDSKYLVNQDFQYIMTANEYEFSPISKAGLYGGLNFDFGSCVVAAYKDIPEKMIFKRTYDG